jgi:acylaminoacyl-peptidase
VKAQRALQALVLVVAASGCLAVPLALPSVDAPATPPAAVLTGAIARSEPGDAAKPVEILAGNPALFQLADVFQLEWASDPQFSPDGKRILYQRNAMSIMSDSRGSSLWIMERDGRNAYPLLEDAGSARWSPSGDRIAYVRGSEHGAQLFVRWLETGATTKVTDVRRSPESLAWSPDGRWLAYTALVPAESAPLVALPSAPEGAKWAEPTRVIDQLSYRNDGAYGYVEPGFRHVFIVPAEGGTPRQLTQGNYPHAGIPRWLPDGKGIVISGQRFDAWEREPQNSEVYRIDVATGQATALTDQNGPDAAPAVSPNGRQIAYLSFADRQQGYQVTDLWVMDVDGRNKRRVFSLDRDIDDPRWSADGRGIFYQYSSEGNGKIGYVSLSGSHEVIASDVGGLSIDRPYASGQFDVARDGAVAFTHTRPDHPADIGFKRGGGATQRFTRLNDDLFAGKTLGQVEEIRFKSSHDQREIQGWIVRPPGFDPSRRYPLILEIHGGPFADYGDRFAAEFQLYAAAGYVVLYVNPRGSTSYGAEFGNLIHHDYPNHDHDDLMSGVDAVVAKGYVDPERLYITGGSGGGVLTAWAIGKTDRFRAAVVAKPVINWQSFVLSSDGLAFFSRYWFPAPPWEQPEHYWKRSPLSLVGNVKTPTMVMVGDSDYRTPMGQAEQYYQALKLRQIESLFVVVPGASHSIDRRPSQMISKVAHILAWFERHPGKPSPS